MSSPSPAADPSRPAAPAVQTGGRRADVIVVGGGPAGASTAWHLATAGLDVLVLDRAAFPRDKACAEYLSPEATRILTTMAAVEPILGAGAAQLRGMRIRSPDGTWLHGEFGSGPAVPGFRQHGLSLRRPALDAILLSRAASAGARVLEGARVADLMRCSAGRVIGVRTVERDGSAREIRAPLVIGADGLRSVVARRLGVARRGPAPNRMAFVGHYEGVEGIGSSGEMHVEADGYIGMTDVGNGQSNAALVVPSAQARAAAGDPAAFLTRWIAGHPHLVARFRCAHRVGGVLATGPFAARTRRPWGPGAALVGDAADYFDPFTGEGIFAALRGGELLAPFALEAHAAIVRDRPRDADAAFRAYAWQRRRTFAGKWIVERAIAATVASPRLMNRAAAVLSRRKDMADTLVGVTGDTISARAVLRPSFLVRLFLAPLPE